MPDRAPQPVERRLPTEESRQLIELVRDMVSKEIAPRAAEEEESGHFPREVFTLLSESGLLGLPYDSAYGGGGQPYEVYLQVLEELAAARLTVGLGVSVHSLACHALAGYGTEEQRAAHLPAMLGGGLLGAYCLSEPSSGSDAASLRTKAVRDGGGASRTSGGTGSSPAPRPGSRTAESPTSTPSWPAPGWRAPAASRRSWSPATSGDSTRPCPRRRWA